jgi:hypothetical protein
MKNKSLVCVLIGLTAVAAGTAQLRAQAGNSGTFNTPAFGGTGSGAVNVNNNSRVNSTSSTNRVNALGQPATALGQPNTALGQQGTGTAITAPAGTVVGTASPAITAPATPTTGAGVNGTRQGTGVAIGQQGTTAIGQQGTTGIGQQGTTALIPQIPQTNGFVVSPDGTTTGIVSPNAQGSSTGAALGGTNTGFGSQTLTNGIRR